MKEEIEKLKTESGAHGAKDTAIVSDIKAIGKKLASVDV